MGLIEQMGTYFDRLFGCLKPWFRKISILVWTSASVVRVVQRHGNTFTVSHTPSGSGIEFEKGHDVLQLRGLAV
jgi:hypothetical protein